MMGNRLIIEGGHALAGTVTISGAKNAAVSVLAATLLTEEECVIDNVPDIGDVAILIDVLRSLGATVEKSTSHRLLIKADDIKTCIAPSQLVSKNRASFLVMGPLLARFGEAASCPPGGDVIGQRPIDVHLAGFAALGAEITRQDEKYLARAQKLRGTKVFLDYPSHIGTENLLMAASLASGKTIIKNASAEPEVVNLAEMLNQMGAQIKGAGTNTIEITGVARLHGTHHTIIPDRIEAGTFAIAGAISGGDVSLEGVNCDHLDSLLWKLEETNVATEAHGNCLRIQAKGPLNATHIQALPFPGFATDLQAAIGVLLTQARGVSVIHERVYENRLLYVGELRKMGAEVVVSGQTAIISGPTPLMGTPVRALDVRCGAALVLAGLAAKGTTEIADVYHLDRGYEKLDAKLRALGAKIERGVEVGCLQPAPLRE